MLVNMSGDTGIAPGESRFTDQPDNNCRLCGAGRGRTCRAWTRWCWGVVSGLLSSNFDRITHCQSCL